MTKAVVFVFGEVLFDCFPSGEQVLGGAPFNVAWHLQALGDQPHFISRVGQDALGQDIIQAMNHWGMDTSSIQIDPLHQTGQVDIQMLDNEPHYTITPDCAYDFIAADSVRKLPVSGILYHGSLALRHSVAREAFNVLANNPQLAIFLDVNLRSPWWQKEDIYSCLSQARWAKLNQHELQQLGFGATDIKQEMLRLQAQFNLQQLIITRGSEGALVLDAKGEFFNIKPQPVDNIVDTVGAGDAFSAVFIHGLLSGWSVPDILNRAQAFASKVIGLRGASSLDLAFYQDFQK
ncbi:MAG: carbohydrate kinase [Methyloprofundus sp.]|nr:carbohydrate kinase [Methyloprofundus sp.]MDT8426432.1 carbohydrate kinase [Methyloprofundus sp.]